MEDDPVKRNPAPSPPTWQRPAALAAISLGVSALVCRYALLPLGLSGFRGALFTGGPIGLVVAGIQLLRASRSNPPVGWRTKMIAILAPAAVVALAGFLLQPPRLENTLQPVALPGIRVSLPPWEIETTGEDWFHGTHRLADPAGMGRFVELRWSIGEPVGTEAMKSALLAMGDLRATQEHVVSVCGHEGRGLRLDAPDGGKESWVAWWNVDGRNVTLISFVHSDSGSPRSVHNAILASVQCLPRPPNATRPQFPIYEPPAGFTRQESEDTVSFESDGGTSIAFTVGGPGRDTYDGVVKTPTLRQHALEAVLEEKVILEAEGRSQAAADGSEQMAWVGQIGTSPDAARIIFAAWLCPAPERTYLGFYAGPLEEPPDVGLRLLARGRCR